MAKHKTPGAEPTAIPAGRYLTKTQVAELRGVIPQTVQHWLAEGWVPSIYISGLGHIINVEDLEGFEPPKRGRAVGAR